MTNDNFDDETDQSSKKVSDAIKKIITAGVGAAFMTEESIRSYLGEIKLPKEAMNYILQGASKSKDEMMEKVGTEIVRVVSKIDFVTEASKFVENHKFKISAEVEVIKKETGLDLKVSKVKSSDAVEE